MTEKTFGEFKNIYSEIAALEVPAELAVKTTLQLMEMAQRETEKKNPIGFNSK